jgi:DNA gyrase subunit B
MRRLTRVINDYARKSGLLKEKEDNLSGDDIREGLTAIILVKLPDPQFEGQTKNKLGNPEVRRYVEQVMNEYFSYYLEENPDVAKKIVEQGALGCSRTKSSSCSSR